MSAVETFQRWQAIKEPFEEWEKHEGWSDLKEAIVLSIYKAQVAAEQRELETWRLRARARRLEARMEGELMLTNKGAKEGTKLLNTKEAAKLLGLSPRSLEQYRWRGTGPKYIKGKGTARRGRYSGLVRYREQDLLEWLGEPQEESA